MVSFGNINAKTLPRYVERDEGREHPERHYTVRKLSWLFEWST